MWKVNAEVQVSKRELHTHIYLIGLRMTNHHSYNSSNQIKILVEARFSLNFVPSSIRVSPPPPKKNPWSLQLILIKYSCLLFVFGFIKYHSVSLVLNLDLPKNTLNYYEIGSSYTWCNSTKVIHFLNYRFLRNLMARKSL